MTVDRDEAGNLWAELPAASGEGFVIVGSHIDAVPSGGWLDGALGIAAALGVVRALAAAARRRRSRCGSSTGPTRRARASAAACSARRPPPGRSIRTTCATCATRTARGCRTRSRRATSTSTRAAGARERLDGAQAYFELHIEQGPVLLDTGRLASAVSGTFGDERYLITFSGQAAHAGSTPMHLRRDTLAAAATRRAGDPRGRHPPRRRHHGRLDAVRARRDHGDRGGDGDDARPARTSTPTRSRRCSTSASTRAASAAAEFDCGDRARGACSARRRRRSIPSSWSSPAPPSRRRAAATASRYRAARCTTRPRSGGLLPTVMIFAQSDPPISHTSVEDSPEDALRVAIEAYGLTVERGARRASAREALLMDFGVVLQTDPPASRVIDLAKRAEQLRLLARVDVRLPPAVGGAVRHLQPDPQRDRIELIVGPMVTNPATRDWTVIASLFATLNEMYGNRTICGIGRGDSAVRVINGKPVRLAELRESIGVIRGLANGEAVDYKGTDAAVRRGTRTAGSTIWVAAYGPKALAVAGEVGDGFILQLADPDITAWSIAAVRRAAEEAGPRPGRGHDLRRRARLRHRRQRGGAGPRPRPVPLVRRHGRQPRRRHRRPLRRRRRRGPDRADRLHRRSRGLRLQRARPRRQHAHHLRPGHDRRPLLPHRPARGRTSPACRSSRTSASTSSRSTCSTTPRTRRSRPTATDVIPAVRVGTP